MAIFSPDFPALRGCEPSTCFFTHYPPSLDSALKKITSSPDRELNEILAKIRKQFGKINIEIGPCSGNKALWILKSRTVKIDTSVLKKSEANIIAYIVFELINASKTTDFKAIIANVNDVENFVRSIEQVEYNNGLSTKKIVSKIVGTEADFDFKHICPTFDLHYALDQIKGHSERLAKTFFPSNEYRGTLAYPLKELDRTSKEVLYELFQLKVECTAGPKGISKSKSPNFEDFVNALSERAKTDPAKYKKAYECSKALFHKSPHL